MFAKIFLNLSKRNLYPIIGRNLFLNKVVAIKPAPSLQPNQLASWETAALDTAQTTIDKIRVKGKERIELANEKARENSNLKANLPTTIAEIDNDVDARTHELIKAMQIYKNCIAQNPKSHKCFSSHHYLWNVLKAEGETKLSIEKEYKKAEGIADYLTELEFRGELPLISDAKKKVETLKEKAAKGADVNQTFEEIKKIETAAAKYLGCRYGVLMFDNVNSRKRVNYEAICAEEEQRLRNILNRKA